MTSTLTFLDLFEHFQSRLGLQWLLGEKWATQQLLNKSRPPEAELIGHMNPVLPQLLQVLGNTEIQYIESLGPARRNRLLHGVCSSHSMALLIADGDTPSQELLKAAKRMKLPVIGSDLSAHELITELNYFLTEVLEKRTILHGVFMEVLGMGVLMTGKSGVGKSELALELISRGSRLIADDAPEFVRKAPDIIAGNCPETLLNFLEVRGLGILNIAHMFGENAVKPSKYLRLIVHLQPLTEITHTGMDRLTGNRGTQKVLGVEVPKVILPVAPGRNLAVLVEAAVRNQTLLRRGYDATQDLIERQQRHIREENG